MAIATVSREGQIVIPSDLRKKYDLHQGRQVMIVDHGNVLAIMPLMDDPVADALGMLQGHSSLLEALRQERVKELLKEG